MPADADLLCEYYLNTTSSSNLTGKTAATQPDESSTLNNELSDLNASDSMELLSKPKLNFPAGSSTSSATLASHHHFNHHHHSHSTKSAAPPTWLDLNWCKIRKTGIGLLNLGNNCYLNATLQCLAYTPPLSQWLVFRPHSPLCKFKQLKGFCSLCEVEKIIYEIFNSCNGFAKPNSLCFNIKKISNVFGVGTQEDASEFFTTLLESMAKSIKFTINLELKQQQQQQANTLNKNKTILDDIFSFQFRSRITCCNCGKLSDTYESTNTWPVDVKYVQDIRKGMLHFVREEVLDGENRYNCDKCNKKVRATKKYSLKTSPNVLVVHLKRFDFTNAGKLTHFVTYPEILNLKSFMSDSTCTSGDSASSDTSNENSFFNTNTNTLNNKNTNYKLYGVLVHLGYTSHSGHYYSYVRGPNDVWYKADDQQVSTVQSQDALGQNAYILFYNRIQSTTQQQQQQQQTPTKDYFHIQTNDESFKSTQLNIPTSLISPDLERNKQTKQNEALPKFKSTFVAVDTTSQSVKLETAPPNKQELKNESDSNRENSKESKSPALTSVNSSKTLNYDQVLRIKKLNKRRLKLFNKKKELAELKKTLNSPSSASEHHSCKKFKKQLRKLKKQIKKYKLKIKKLKRKNKKYLTSDENESKTGGKITNSLSLLKQYNSSSSSSSSLSSSAESSPCSTPKSNRSSISSARSSSSSSGSSVSSVHSTSTRKETPCENATTSLKTKKEEPAEIEAPPPPPPPQPLKVKLNDTNSSGHSSCTNADSHSSSSSSAKRFKCDDELAKRPELDSSKSSSFSSSSASYNSNKSSSSSNNSNKYFNSTKHYHSSSSSNSSSSFSQQHNQQYSWRNNYKYKYSSPYYHQNPHYNNYNKNKSYHFSRY